MTGFAYLDEVAGDPGGVLAFAHRGAHGPDADGLPENTMADAERWATSISGPAYAIDDETAIKVVDDTVEVVSEGHWKLFTSQ